MLLKIIMQFGSRNSHQSLILNPPIVSFVLYVTNHHYFQLYIYSVISCLVVFMKKSLAEERPLISGKKIAIFVVGALVFSALVSE